MPFLANHFFSLLRFTFRVYRTSLVSYVFKDANTADHFSLLKLPDYPTFPSACSTRSTRPTSSSISFHHCPVPFPTTPAPLPHLALTYHDTPAPRLPCPITVVCPTEILAFNAALDKFAAIGTEVIGVSTDSEFTHLAWSQTPRKEGGLGPDLKLTLVR